MELDQERRRGRPKSGDSPWGYYAEAAPSRAMRLLALEAERQRLTVQGLARRAGVNIKVLTRYFEAKEPRLKTVVRLCRALGYEPTVARALAREITDNDRRAILQLLVDEVEILRSDLFTDSAGASRALQNALRALPKNVTDEAFADFLIGYRGLDDHGLPFRGQKGAELDPILGPGLDALHRVLQREAFSVSSFIANRKALVERKREAISWFRLLSDTVGFTATDEAKIAEILRAYLGHPFGLGPGRRTHSLVLVGRDFLPLSDNAMQAARWAYNAERTKAAAKECGSTREDPPFGNGEEKLVTDEQAARLLGSSDFIEAPDDEKTEAPS